MKKTFFTRAFASAIAAPLAFTSLTSALAAGDGITIAGEGSGFSLSQLIFIEPTTPIVDGVQDSAWNETVGMSIYDINSFTKVIDLETATSFISTFAGSYADAVLDLFAASSDVVLTYDTSNRGVFTFEGTVNGIQAFAEEISDKALGKLLDDEQVLHSIDLSCLSAPIEVKLTVDASAVAAFTSKTVTVSYDITANGKSLTLIGEDSVYGYAMSKLSEVKAAVIDCVGANVADSVAKKFDSAEKKIAYYYDKALSVAAGEYSRSYANVDQALAAGKAFASKKLEALMAEVPSSVSKLAESKKLAATVAGMPASVAELASNANVNKVLDEAIAFASDLGFAVTVPMNEVTDILNAIYDITVSYADGNTTLKAFFPDEEQADVAAYVATLDGGKYVLVDSYKEFEISAAAGSLAETGEGGVYYNIKRYIVTELVTDSSSTTTTTTTTSDDRSLTTTTTSVSGSGTTTTTSVSGSGTTTTISTSGSGSGTTTTISTSGSGSGTTTTTTTHAPIVSYEVVEFEAEPGLYNVEDEAFDINQVNSIEVKFFLEDDTTMTVTDVSQFHFGEATPETTFELGKHKYDVQIWFEDKALVLDDETAVAIRALIGYRGDINLNDDVDADDASRILEVYIVRSVKEPDLILNEDAELNELCYFLADTCDDLETDAYAWAFGKARKIDADDASKTLSFYAEVMVNLDVDYSVIATRRSLWFDIWNIAIVEE